MFVDARVAHGRARFDLNRSPRMFSEERRGEVSAIITTCLDNFTGTRNRRNLLRLLERQVAPKLARLGIDPYVGVLGQIEGLFVNFSTMSAEHGLREFQLQVTVPELVLRSFACSVIKPHAVARCMQRNGVMSIDEIGTETSVAFVLARVMRPLALAEKWQQVGVPGINGLFVGVMTDNDDICMNTYLKPASNDRASRWSGFAGLFATMPSWSAEQIRQGSDLLQWTVNHIVALRKTASFVERFPFLLEPYHGTDDPLDATWNAARASARTESRS
ncbi:hypothetical protein N0A02_25355 [Paraburkholderia acidicola]|uniref:Uncharacterized protein n=1 Tax=Paraburkholderia acidicola TaxID=1912599 RepID=A0ABV1LTY3_9BURK